MSLDERPVKSPGALRLALLVVSALLAVGLFGVAGWSMFASTDAVAAEPARGGDRELAWTEFGGGMDRARAGDLPLLVNFNATWCGYCRKMDRETWSHPAVLERLGDVVAVRVDIDDERRRNGFSGTELAQTYRVNGTPTQMLIDPSGRVLSRADGFQTARQFLLWLESGLGAEGAVRAPAAGS